MASGNTTLEVGTLEGWLWDAAQQDLLRRLMPKPMPQYCRL